jgi:hypothetical protein
MTNMDEDLVFSDQGVEETLRNAALADITDDVSCCRCQAYRCQRF